MNPSVRELADAAERANAEAVVLLPNNRNVVPAAIQAAESAGKPVYVVPTRSMPQGIAAALSFSPESGAEENVEQMTEAAEDVRTGEVTTAVRSASVDGVDVESGQLMGLLEHRVVSAGGGLADTVAAILREADVSEGELVTLYAGEPVGEEDGSSVVDALAARVPRRGAGAAAGRPAALPLPALHRVAASARTEGESATHRNGMVGNRPGGFGVSCR